jgi:hypothetical protein
MLKVIGLGTAKLSLPLGPSTEMVWPLVAVLTPFGIVLGALPIRDMVAFPVEWSGCVK